MISPTDGASSRSSPSGTTDLSVLPTTLNPQTQLPVEETPQQRWDRIAKAKEGRDELGRFAAYNAQPQVATPAVDSELETKEVAPTPDKRLAPALSGLRAPAALHKAIEKDADLQKWVLDLAGRISEASRMAGELKTLRDTKLKPADAASGKQAPEHPANDGTLQDLTADFAETLMLDEDGRRKLDAVFEPMMAENRQLKSDIDELWERVSHQYAYVARAQLVGELPELKEGPGYKRVQKEMEGLAGLPKYEALDDPIEKVVQIMRDAHAIVFQSDTRRKLESRAKSQSQPTLKELKASTRARFAGIPDHVARGQLLSEGIPPDQVKALLYD